MWARLQRGPARPKALADELGLAPSTVTAQVRRLERAGLVRRLPSGALGAAGAGSQSS